MPRKAVWTLKTEARRYSNPSLLNKEGMKYWFAMFLLVVLGASMFLQTPVETLTCSRPVYGPHGAHPGLYGPGDGPYSPGAPAAPEHKHPGCRVRNSQTVEDDGKASSDTATRNPNNLPVYAYSPSIERSFPTEGCPPMPFLNNFKHISR